MRSVTARPVEGRHVDVGAERRLGERDRHRDGEVVAAAAEQRMRRRRGSRRSRSPGGPPLRPGPPRPLRRIVWPSATPAGIRALTSRGALLDAGAATRRARVVDRRCPAPAHRGTAMENENRPWLSSTTPRPPQFAHTLGLVPGLAPEPLQVRALRVAGEVQRGGDARARRRRSRACSSASRSLPPLGAAARRRRPPAPPPPRPNRSPSRSPRSPPSMSPTLNVKPPGPAAGRARRRHRPEPADLVVLLRAWPRRRARRTPPTPP